MPSETPKLRMKQSDKREILLSLVVVFAFMAVVMLGFIGLSGYVAQLL